MWFTGRFSGAATVLVLDPSQVTGFPVDVGVLDAVVCVLDPEPAAGSEAEEPEEPEELVGRDEELAPEPAEEGPGEGLVEVVAAAPSSWVPVPSLHAVRERAARTAVAAAPARRAREVRRLDMLPCPFGVRVVVLVG